MDFSSYPIYRRYRGLRLAEPLMVGYDVFALQTALVYLKFHPGTVDGFLGEKTESAINSAQGSYGLTIDGIAGLNTQTALCKRIFTTLRGKYTLPYYLLHGQVEHESSFWLGNYSPIRDDGSYDAGVAQRNTKLTSAEQGFNVPLSLDALAKSARTYYGKFEGVKNNFRRWQLAQGAWNAPAFAGWIANEEGAHVPRNEIRQPSDVSRAKIEAYMGEVSKYLKVSGNRV